MNNFEYADQCSVMDNIKEINDKLNDEYEKENPSKEVIQKLMFEQLLRGLNLQLFQFQNK